MGKRLNKIFLIYHPSLFMAILQFGECQWRALFNVSFGTPRLAWVKLNTCNFLSPDRPHNGGIKGGSWGIPPPLEALPPTCPHRRKNGQNQPFTAIFFIFAPQNRILSPRCPQKKKKKSGAATAPTSGTKRVTMEINFNCQEFLHLHIFIYL